MINLDDFTKVVFDLIDSPNNIEYSFPKGHKLYVNRVALQQIFINLLGNAINHNDKKTLKANNETLTNEIDKMKAEIENIKEILQASTKK